MKLTDTQSAVLAAAAARASGALLPLPSHLRGGAIAKVLDALIAKGFAVANGGSEVEGPVISDAGRQALGLPLEPSLEADGAWGAMPNKQHPAPRANTKHAQLIAMLRTPEGASVEEITTAFSWQAHTIRGAIAGALKKKLGLHVSSEAIEGRGRVYRIVE